MAKKKSKINPKPKGRKNPSSTQKFWTHLPTLLPIVAIILITFICFYPSLDNAFVNWDDDRNFYENDLITGINSTNFWSMIGKIMVTPVIGNYNPLPIVTFAIEKQLFGLDQPHYWHLDNILLHLICTFLVYRIGLLMGLDVMGSAILALLFGIHPMRVESVAWITERKDVLFGAFYLAAMYYYIKYVQQNFRKRYLALIFLFFTLSLFSKIQAVVLPLTMLAIDYWLGRKMEFKRIIEKIPFFLISLLIGLLGIYFLRHQGSFESNTTYEWYVRPFIGTYAYLIYLIKVLIPFRLSPLYPYPNVAPWYFYVSALGIPLYLWVFYRAWKKEMKAVVFGLAFFTFNIFFVLQILGAGQGFLADRFSYIAYFGLFFIMAYYSKTAITHYPKYKNVIQGLILAIFVAYGYITFQQNKIWKNSETLWTHVLKYYTNITLPFGNRANYLRDLGRNKEALADYNQAIRLDSKKPEQFNSRAKLYFASTSSDTLQLALNDYNRAIELDNTKGEYYVNRGAVHARFQNYDLALQDFNKGLQLDPNHVTGYLNRSVIYNQLGQTQEALNDLEIYLKARPNSPDMWYESARAKRILGRHAESIPDFSNAIQQNPTKAIFYFERAKALMYLDRRAEAKNDYLIAKQMNFAMPQNFVDVMENQ